MRMRRCTFVHLEPRERLEFDLELLIEGGNGLRDVLGWVALCPHLDTEVMLSSSEVHALGALSPSQWREHDEIVAEHSPQVVALLHAKHLLLGEGSAIAARDEKLRDTYWRPASAVMHYASRWSGIDAHEALKQITETEGGDLLSKLGAPEPVVREHAAPDARLRLPAPPSSALDDLFALRVTCRNFDLSRSLTLEQFSAVLYRAWGARTVHDYAPGVPLLKKGVPSAGGLHTTEAYLLVQRVDGVAPGLYHYHPIDHALEPLRALAAEQAAALARQFVAGQTYFVDAHVMIVAVSRFLRNFWKYRNHAKAYRAITLDIGHLSQAQYLAATELGLAAFITAAINEVDIEKAFGLDPLEEGPLAVTGFGIRAAERREVEWDPLNAVWPAR
jgi:putative peptide maturation dehydrogenase